MPTIDVTHSARIAGADLVFPHCDPRVLHAPGTCAYCDQHPERQALREAWAIAFTGQAPGPSIYGPPLLPDPAATQCGSDPHIWGGNRPHPPTPAPAPTAPVPPPGEPPAAA